MHIRTAPTQGISDSSPDCPVTRFTATQGPGLGWPDSLTGAPTPRLPCFPKNLSPQWSCAETEWRDLSTREPGQRRKWKPENGSKWMPTMAWVSGPHWLLSVVQPGRTKQLSGLADRGTKGGRGRQTCKSWVRKFSSLLPSSQLSEAQITETQGRLRPTGSPGRKRSFLPREPESVVPDRKRPFPWPRRGLVKVTLTWGCSWNKTVKVNWG